MKNRVSYSELLEQWERDAYAGHYGSDWLEQIGENVKFYAEKCEIAGNRPTFAGLMKHLENLHYYAEGGLE